LLRRANSLVTSPVVIALWEPVARKLGWPDKAIGWKELFEAAKDPDFRYGQTRPEQSNSGLSALIAQFYAGAQVNNNGRPVRVLTLKYIDDPAVRRFVEQVHGSVIHYGNSTGFYAQNMINAGPNYADAAVLYESDVIVGNNTIQTTLKGKYPRLIAIYPEEGTFEANHPFTFVQREWVDEEEREAAEIYYEFLLKPEQQAKALTKGFRPTVNLDIEDSVYDRLWNENYGVAPFKTTHRYLPAPTGEVITAARNAFRKLKKQAHVVLVIDKSGSMDKVDAIDESQAVRMERAVEGAKLVIDNLQPVDRVNIVVFDHRARFLPETPPHKPLQADAQGKATLKRALDCVRPGGNTAMFDAVVDAWESLCTQIKRDPSDRAIRAIILLTDGEDTASKRYKNAPAVIGRIGYAKEKRGGGYYGDPQCKIAVFAIAYADSQQGGESPVLRPLELITEATRGDAKEGSNVSIRRLFQDFGDFL
jgi:Ca-activated chloride channel family protein